MVQAPQLPLQHLQSLDFAPGTHSEFENVTKNIKPLGMRVEICAPCDVIADVSVTMMSRRHHVVHLVVVARVLSIHLAVR